MSADLSAHLRAAAAIFRRDVLVFLSYRTAVVTRNVSVIANLALFYYIARFVRVEPFDSPEEYFAYAVIGIAILRVVHSTMQLPGTMQGELVAGTFERILLSPFGPTAAAVAMLAFPLLEALFVATLTLVIAALVFGLDLQWTTVPAAIPIGLLGALSFAGFAMLFAASVIVFKQAPGVGLVVTALTIVGGLYFPISVLPAWLRWLSEVQPLTPTVDLLRQTLVGFEADDPLLSELARIVAFVVTLLPVSAFALSRAVVLARKRGTIIEY